MVVQSDKLNAMWIKCTRRQVIDIDANYSGYGKLNMAEDELQTAALQRLARWTGLCAAVSASGIVLLYYMITGQELKIWLGVAGVLVLILGAASAFTLLIGIRNGRNNVRKILKAIEDRN